MLLMMVAGATNSEESVNFAARKLLAVPFVGWLIADKGMPVRRLRWAAKIVRVILPASASPFRSSPPL
jgi:hypothetical protein